VIMTTVALYLENDRPVRAAEFRKAAHWYMAQHGGKKADIWPIYCTRDILEVSTQYEREEVENLGIFAHGTPKAFGRPGRFGISTTSSDKYESVREFARRWGPVMARDGLLSLACCLCSRDPKWYRVQLFGRDVSAWSPRAYEDGGTRSIAAKLVEAFGPTKGLEVRGHCAAGHTTRQALLRSHIYSDGGGIGRALFGMVHDTNTAARRKIWQKVVRGELAAKWLCGVGPSFDLVGDIRERV